MSAGADDPVFASNGVRSRAVSIEAAAVAGIICAIGWSLSLRGLQQKWANAVDEALACPWSSRARGSPRSIS